MQWAVISQNGRTVLKLLSHNLTLYYPSKVSRESSVGRQSIELTKKETIMY